VTDSVVEGVIQVRNDTGVVTDSMVKGVIHVRSDPGEG